MSYLTDTNVISEITRLRPHAGVYAQWWTKSGLIGGAAVTWHELLTGISLLPASQRRTAFVDFLQGQLILTTLVLGGFCPIPQKGAIQNLGVFAYYRVVITDYKSLPLHFDKQIQLPERRRRRNGG